MHFGNRLEIERALTKQERNRILDAAGSAASSSAVAPGIGTTTV